ncbi:MAG: S9 family peptidase [Chloroflexota bacterium]|nr:S9 family peptidase [Chloroflexota bacterium]
MPSTTRGRPLEATDLFRIQLVSDPQPSPDGQWIAYVLTTLHQAEDEYRAAIWVAPVGPGEPRQLTSGTVRDTAPRWSPDGSTLAFLSNRPPHRKPPMSDDESSDTTGADSARKQKSDGDAKRPTNQIWLLPFTGGEPRQLTAAEFGASSPEWSPMGDVITFVAKSDSEAGNAPMTNGSEADERIIRHIRYRYDGEGYIERYAHIWTIPAVGGDAAQITKGDAQDSQPIWSRDGQSIIFISNRRSDRARSAATTLYSVPAKGGEARQLTDENARFNGPSPSPDGTRIAFTGHLDYQANGRNVALWTVASGGNESTNHTERHDRSFTDSGMSDVYVGNDTRPVWQSEASVLSLCSSEGATSIVSVDLASNEVRQVIGGPRRIIALAVTRTGQVVFVAGDGHHPFELFIADADGANERQLTHHNETLLGEVHLAELQDLKVTSADGTPIQAWIMPPYGFDAASGVKQRLIVQIHGGPHAMYGYAMFHEMQLMAARGYAVLFCNPRGSDGYGEEFTTTTRGRWGESDMPDVMAALDAVLKLGWIDEHRLGVTGGSYGGYLTNWIIGHTDRFRAAVTQRCVANFASFFGTSDIGYDFGEREFGGVPWTHADLLRRHSPITYVENMKTPLLILHSEQDLRCPIEQAEQLFTALKYLDREVGFVRFPEENHNLSRAGKPSRRLARLHHLIGWFDRQL